MGTCLQMVSRLRRLAPSMRLYVSYLVNVCGDWSPVTPWYNPEWGLPGVMSSLQQYGSQSTKGTCPCLRVVGYLRRLAPSLRRYDCLYSRRVWLLVTCYSLVLS